MFRSQATQLKFALQDGLEVLVFARLSVYEPRGDYQLLVEAVEPKGMGALQLAFMQLKAKLDAEGVFNISRKRPLPPYPQRIGIVTSPFGAVIHDLLTIMRRRWPLARTLIAPVAVQGGQASGQIVRAIQMLNQMGDLDILIIGRGGGSAEDLWAFNEEIVVRAIISSRIPVVSAVGHEIDVTLADLAADCRAPTPSAAAELVVPDCSTVKSQIGFFRNRLERSLKSMISAWTVRTQSLCRGLPEPRLMIGHFMQRVDELERQLYVRVKHWCRTFHVLLLGYQSAIWEGNPSFKVRRHQNALGELEGRLVRGIQSQIQEKHHRVRLGISQLHQLSPLAVLARGYSIVKVAKDGKVLKKSTDVEIGASVRARLYEGELLCAVEKVYPPK